MQPHWRSGPDRLRDGTPRRPNRDGRCRETFSGVIVVFVMSEAQTELIDGIDAGDLDVVRRMHQKAMKYGYLWNVFQDDYDVRC